MGRPVAFLRLKLHLKFRLGGKDYLKEYELMFVFHIDKDNGMWYNMRVRNVQ